MTLTIKIQDVSTPLNIKPKAPNDFLTALNPQFYNFYNSIVIQREFCVFPEYYKTLTCSASLRELFLALLNAKLINSAGLSFIINDCISIRGPVGIHL